MVDVDAEVVSLDVADNNEPDPEGIVVHEDTFVFSEVGDVMLISNTQPFPEEWHPLDGSKQISAMWPEYVERLKITTGTFMIPDNLVAGSGHMFIIKLGKKNTRGIR